MSVPEIKDQTSWNMEFKLGHRGCPGCTIVQTSFLLLTARLEDSRAWRDREKFVDEIISPLRHLYGDLYIPGMEKGISELN